MIDIKKVKKLLDEGHRVLNTGHRSYSSYEFVDEGLFYGWHPKF